VYEEENTAIVLTTTPKNKNQKVKKRKRKQKAKIFSNPDAPLKQVESKLPIGKRE